MNSLSSQVNMRYLELTENFLLRPCIFKGRRENLIDFLFNLACLLRSRELDLYSHNYIKKQARMKRKPKYHSVYELKFRIELYLLFWAKTSI